MDTNAIAAEQQTNGDKEVLSVHKNTEARGIIKSSRETQKSSGETPSCSTSRPSPSFTLFGRSVTNPARRPVLPRAGCSSWWSTGAHTAWFGAGCGVKPVAATPGGGEHRLYIALQEDAN